MSGWPAKVVEPLPGASRKEGGAGSPQNSSSGRQPYSLR